MKSRAGILAAVLVVSLSVVCVYPAYAEEPQEASETKEEVCEETELIKETGAGPEEGSFWIYAGKEAGRTLWVNGATGTAAEGLESFRFPEGEEWKAQWEAWHTAGFESWESQEGETVIMEVQPEDDYEWEKLQVLDKYGNFLELTETENGCKFRMPASDVLVSLKMQGRPKEDPWGTGEKTEIPGIPQALGREAEEQTEELQDKELEKYNLAAAAQPRYSGSYYTADAYEQFALGQSVQLWGLTTAGGYGDRQYIFALKNGDNSLVDSWEEGVMGTPDGIPFFCIEADIDYNNSVLATVYEGRNYLSQDEIIECALACKYMEDHISVLNGNKTDLFFLQQCAVWTIRENHGYRAYSVQTNYVAPYTVSHNGDINFAYAFVQNSIAWAIANKGNYTGYCKVLDNHTGQKCGVFKAVENPKGTLAIQKSSALPQISDNNACYSLEGAEYTVYQMGTDTVVGTITTDAGGYGTLGNLPAGSYDIVEMKAPKGYLLDSTRHTITINAGQTTTYQAKDEPGNDPVLTLLVKRDVETGKPMGNARLKGAEYTVKYYDVNLSTDPAEIGITEKYTWILETDEKGRAYLDNAHKISGDEFVIGLHGNPVLPLGTITIQESKAPEGYLLNTTLYVANTIQQNGSVSTTNLPNEETYAATEQVKRGDLEFTKLDTETGRFMAGIPFRVISQTTGENHILVADADGHASTSAVPHSAETNENDAVIGEADYSSSFGIWFGGSEPDDTKGALPYDTYTVRELPCEANYGKDLAEFTVTISENGKTVDVGTVENQTILTNTKARDAETGTQVITSVNYASIVDTFYYENLTPGRKYTVKGAVRNPETGEVIVQNGAPLIAEKAFTSAAVNGEVKLTFLLHAAELEGKQVVVTEELYDGDSLRTTHEDLDDPDQTVTVLTGDLTVTKTIAADEIIWAHGNPTFLVKVSGFSQTGKGQQFYHTYEFTREYVEANTAPDGTVSLLYMFQDIPTSERYRVEELPVSRYSLTDMEGNGSNVTTYFSDKSSGFDSYVLVNLVNQPSGTQVTITNQKTNDAWESHTALLHNVIQ